MSEPEFRRNLPDLALLLAGDRIVGSGDREEAVEQLTAFFVAGDLLELARDEEVLGAAEQPVLAVGDFGDEQRLLLGNVAEPLNDLHNLSRLDVADLEVRAGDAAQDVRERRQMPCAGGFEFVQLADNAPDRVSVAI